MFKTVKRIIDWCGEFKGKLYLGFIFSFFSYWFAAMPVMVAAYTIGMLLDAGAAPGHLTARGSGRVLLSWECLSFCGSCLTICGRGARRQSVMS